MSKIDIVKEHQKRGYYVPPCPNCGCLDAASMSFLRVSTADQQIAKFGSQMKCGYGTKDGCQNPS